MTTIITRLYADQTAARAAMSALLNDGHDPDHVEIITGDVAGGAAAAMKSARISAASAAAYGKAMTGRQALLVMQAPFNPVGTARNAIKVLKRHPALDVGLADENVYLREQPRVMVTDSIMAGHPHFMTNPYVRPGHGHILGSNPIIQSRDRTSAIRGGAYMSRFFWPTRLLSAPKERTSAIRGGFFFSSIFGIPLLTRSWASRDDIPTILR